jgi:hypothetical protein
MVKAVGGSYVGAVETGYTISQIGPENKALVTSRRSLATQRQKTSPAAFFFGWTKCACLHWYSYRPSPYLHSKSVRFTGDSMKTGPHTAKHSLQYFFLFIGALTHATPRGTSGERFHASQSLGGAQLNTIVLVWR